MENVYIDLGDDMTIGDGSSMVIGEDNLYTESETMVGPQGPPGPPGPAGFSPVATVTQNAGSATITITDATTTSSATVYDGTDGVDGAAASITVGSTTTGEPGTQASVTNSGTSSAAVLDFVIPKGAKGDQGEQGDAATVDVGTIVSIAPDATPQVTNSGTVHDAILNFAIPQGYDGFSPVATVTQNTGSATISITDENGTTTATVYDGQDGAPGQQGPAGQDGAAATVTVGSTTTGNAGTNAIVTNSGTSSAAVLDFVIPRGADGQNGTNGTDGADGFSPIATVTQNTGSATISITDANGTTTATVNDGATGATGATGPQGPTGPTGPTGATPNITMSATVDNTTGTPSVTVNASGTAENPVFQLAFEHLKGETGTLPAPTNYVSTITPTLGTFNTNGQQVMLYGDGTVLVNISLTTNQVLNAKTAYSLLTIPTAIRPTDAKNRLLTAYAYCRTTGGAFVRPYDNQIRVWFMDQIPSGAEINIFGVYNIN